LWLQEKVHHGTIELQKVKGTANWADALTKYLEGGKIQEHLELTSQEIKPGRHQLMPALDGKVIGEERAGTLSNPAGEDLGKVGQSVATTTGRP
jgi:hypothetical protein